MKVSDKVGSSDGGSIQLRSKGSVVGHREFGGEEDMYKPLIHTEGWVRLFMRERGKIVPGSHRSGRNTWTNTGREYLALHQTINAGLPDPPAWWVGPCPYRVDLIGYVGVGIGAQIEDPGVLNLNTPVAYSGGASGTFLAPIEAVSFPLTPVSTTVEYHILFGETEISQDVSSVVNVSEMGLFTNGDPTTDRASGARLTNLDNALYQAPVAYKTFEPINKRRDLELEIFWQIRF